MNLKQATTFLLWYGEKVISGHEPTEEEFEMFKEAHAVSASKAGILRIKPSDHAYTPGKPFGE